MDRTTIAVDRDVVRKLSKIVRKYNMVLSSFSSEALSTAGELLEMGITPTDLRNIMKLLKLGMLFDLMLLPSELFETLIKVISTGEKIDLEKEFYEWGVKVGNVVKTYYSDSIEELIEAIAKGSRMLSLKDLDLSRKNEDLLELKLAGAGKSKLVANLTYMFIKGFFETLDYTIVDKTVSIGIIRLTLKKNFSVFK